MEKPINENLIHETTQSPDKSREGFEMTAEQAGQIIAEFSKLNDAISHDKPIKVEDLEVLKTMAKGMKIDVGGIIMTVEEAENDPELKRNSEIWTRIRKGEVDDLIANRFVEKLTIIPDDVAKILSQEKGFLKLSSLKFISNITAKYLSEHKGGELYLEGITHINDTVAEYLAKYVGILRLGITSIPDHFAECLSRNPKIYLDSLDPVVSLSDTAAKHLSTFPNSLLFSNLATLSDTAVEYLSQCPKALGLGLTSLTDSAAKSLARHKGNLFLLRVTNLSDTAARILAEYEGDLFIDDTIGAQIAKFKK